MIRSAAGLRSTARRKLRCGLMEKPPAPVVHSKLARTKMGRLGQTPARKWALKRLSDFDVT
ncbi:hypothetical protein IMZ48_44845 [Candidatus Bathyarchaeota archaeon]|nr:hypothetical protein [Candidatus Bathyarchaeota archaeon]